MLYTPPVIEKIVGSASVSVLPVCRHHHPDTIKRRHVWPIKNEFGLFWGPCVNWLLTFYDFVKGCIPIILRLYKVWNKSVYCTAYICAGAISNFSVFWPFKRILHLSGLNTFYLYAFVDYFELYFCNLDFIKSLKSVSWLWVLLSALKDCSKLDWKYTNF